MAAEHGRPQGLPAKTVAIYSTALINHRQRSGHILLYATDHTKWCKGLCPGNHFGRATNDLSSDDGYLWANRTFLKGFRVGRARLHLPTAPHHTAPPLLDQRGLPVSRALHKPWEPFWRDMVKSPLRNVELLILMGLVGKMAREKRRQD